jgi:type I restriction enzyme R subunit
MLITGFDAPKLKVMYLDKPLYEHRLLQAIARVNRPYEGKKFGLIVDSVGLLNYVKESLRKYNLIAEGEIASDIEENLLKKIDEKFENFKELLENAKNMLKSLRIEDKDLSIDVDEIRKLLKDKREALRFLREVVEPKIKIIALFWDRAQIQRVINGLKEVIQLFKALGSHKEKIHYVEEMDILTFIYSRILYYIKGRRVPREFWDELIELIHDKTIVEGFEELSKTKISAGKIVEKLSAKVVSDEIIGDAYSIAISLLSLEPANPVHKEIWRRIESVRRDWVARRGEFITILAEAIREKLEYDKSVRSKPVEDRIVETVKLLIRRRFGKSISVEGFKRKVSEMSSNILEKHRREIQKTLMMDIFKQAKDIPPRDVAEFVREVSDYVIEELRRMKR